MNFPPISTTTDGVSADALVWFIEGSQLAVVDGDTGTSLHHDGRRMRNVPSMSFPIAVKNRIVVSALGTSAPGRWRNLIRPGPSASTASMRRSFCASPSREKEMAAESVRVRLLRACGVVEPGLEPAFDRLARLAVPSPARRFASWRSATGPPRGSRATPARATCRPPTRLLRILLRRAGRRPLPWASHGEVAGAAIQDRDRRRRRRRLRPRARAAHLARTRSTPSSTSRSSPKPSLQARRTRRPDESTARIVEAITDACFFLDRDWRYTYVNRKAGEIFGRQPQDLIGKHIWTEFPEGIGLPFYSPTARRWRSRSSSSSRSYYPPSPLVSAPHLPFTHRARGLLPGRHRAKARRAGSPSSRHDHRDHPGPVAVSDAQGALAYVNRAGPRTARYRGRGRPRRPESRRTARAALASLAHRHRDAHRQDRARGAARPRS